LARRRITRVTTRRGDAGETSLADGSAVAKTDPRIHTIGAVDELNSFVGLLVTELVEDHPFLAFTGRLQQELFDLGAHLATVGATPLPELDWLETTVDELNGTLPPLREFVIPGGTRGAAMTHVCRTICRRAERHCWDTGDAEGVARYLNRLSDLFFVMARCLNADTGDEAQWRGISAPESDSE
jgi:cob(I)alamin adenosyltransferase